MRIDASGNVGIGTDNPSENLHIYSSSAAADVKLEAARRRAGFEIIYRKERKYKPSIYQFSGYCK